MAYLIFTVKGRELGRRPLAGPMVIGRSPDCDVCVHDILLSRRHCQVEADGSDWVLVDLASKNGSYFGTQEIGRHVLSDGHSVRIGKTTLTFHAGKMQTAPRGGEAMDKPNQSKLKRAADPWEALNATVSGMDYLKERAKQKEERIGGRRRVADSTVPISVASRFPSPQPSPREPDAYVADDVYSLLTELASSSWDSIYMNARRAAPRRPAPTPMVGGSRHARYRSESAVDLSLQVSAGLLAPKPRSNNRSPRWRRTFVNMAKGFAMVGQTVMVLGIGHLLGKI